MWFKKKVIPPPVQLPIQQYEWVIDCEAMQLGMDYMHMIDDELYKLAVGHITQKDSHGNPLITVEDMRFAGEKILNDIRVGGGDG